MTTRHEWDNDTLDAFLELKHCCERVAWLFEQVGAARSDSSEGQEVRLQILETDYKNAREQLADRFQDAQELGSPHQSCEQLVIQRVPLEALE